MIKAQNNRIFALLLAMLLLFATQHLAMHDIDGAAGGVIGHHKCQLNHLPFEQSSPSLLAAPLLTPVLFLVTPLGAHLRQVLIHFWQARAPPQF